MEVGLRGAIQEGGVRLFEGLKEGHMPWLFIRGDTKKVGRCRGGMDKLVSFKDLLDDGVREVGTALLKEALTGLQTGFDRVRIKME